MSAFPQATDAEMHSSRRWIGSIMLNSDVMQTLFEDAALMAPQEMCGLMFHDVISSSICRGDSLHNGQYLRCTNVDQNPERGFLLHHNEYQEAVKHMGQEPWALVHSHPTTGAGASPKDCGLMDALEMANSSMMMVIVGLNPRKIRIFKKDAHVY